MKKIIIIIIFFISALGGLSQSEKPDLKNILSDITNEKWNLAFNELNEIVSKIDNTCDVDAVTRLLYGHIALIIGENNVSTKQFYCNCDSINSATLNNWQTFTEEFESKNPDLAISHYLVADALARKGNFEKSKLEFDKSLQIDENFVPSLNARAVINWLLYENSEPKNESFKIAALKDINKAINTNPGFADLYANKALFSMRNTGNMEYARKDLEKAVEIDSSYYLAFNSIAVSYGEEGNSNNYYDIEMSINQKDPDTPFMGENYIANNIIGNERGVTIGASVNNLGIMTISGSVNPSEYFKGVSEYFGGFNNSFAKGISGLYGGMSNLTRGGIFSYLKEGENLVTTKDNSPVLIGTWFNLNYPGEQIKLDNE